MERMRLPNDACPIARTGSHWLGAVGHRARPRIREKRTHVRRQEDKPATPHPSDAIIRWQTAARERYRGFAGLARTISLLELQRKR